MNFLYSDYQSLFQYVKKHDIENRPEESMFFLNGLLPEIHILQGKIEYEKNQSVENEQIIEYQNLSNKVQDLADRVEKICSRKEASLPSPDSAFNSGDLRVTVINENDASTHFNRIADQIDLLEIQLSLLPSLSQDQRKKEIINIRKKIDQLNKLANINNYQDIQNNVLKEKTDNLIKSLENYEVTYRKLDNIYSKLQFIESSYHALELQRLEQTSPNPPSERSSFIHKKGIKLLEELDSLLGELVRLVDQNLKYFKKEEILSLDQTFSDTQEKCEGMLHEIGVQFKVQDSYQEIVEMLEDPFSYSVSYYNHLENLSKRQLSYIQFLFSPNSEQALKWQNLVKRIQIRRELEDLEKLPEEDIGSVSVKLNKAKDLKMLFQETSEVSHLKIRLQKLIDKLQSKQISLFLKKRVNDLEKQVLSLVDPDNELVRGNMLTLDYQHRLANDRVSFTEKMIETKLALEKCKRDIFMRISKEKDEGRIHEDGINQLTFLMNNRIDMLMDSLDSFSREKGLL